MQQQATLGHSFNVVTEALITRTGMSIGAVADKSKILAWNTACEQQAVGRTPRFC
jgi:hypothetical protein